MGLTRHLLAPDKIPDDGIAFTMPLAIEALLTHGSPGKQQLDSTAVTETTVTRRRHNKTLLSRTPRLATTDHIP